LVTTSEPALKRGTVSAPGVGVGTTLALVAALAGPLTSALASGMTLVASDADGVGVDDPQAVASVTIRMLAARRIGLQPPCGVSRSRVWHPPSFIGPSRTRRRVDA
jgi:hypothetical protein